MHWVNGDSYLSSSGKILSTTHPSPRSPINSMIISAVFSLMLSNWSLKLSRIMATNCSLRISLPTFLTRKMMKSSVLALY